MCVIEICADLLYGKNDSLCSLAILHGVFNDNHLDFKEVGG